MARNKGQRDFDFALAFYAASFLSYTETSNPQGVSLPHADCGEKKISPFIHAAKFPNRIEASQLARDAYAHRQLRGSRAAIGSGGKKARPF